MPTSLLRLTLVLVGVLALIAIAGCRNPFTPRLQPPALPSNGTPPRGTNGNTVSPQPGTGTGEAEAQAVVVTYVTALQEGRYAAAYDMLSSDSQQAHSRASFEQSGKKGMPLYDLKKLTATVSGDRVEVAAPLLEDPATHGFTLVREGQAWKIVYRGGRPGAPVAE